VSLKDNISLILDIKYYNCFIKFGVVMQKHNLIQHNDLKKDLFFWIKVYLGNKLLTINTTKASQEFDDSVYYNKILECTSKDKLEAIQKEILKYKLMSFYNYSSVMISFYTFIEQHQSNIKTIKDINNQLIYENFRGKYLEKKSYTTKKRFYMAIINFFNFIDQHCISDDDFKFNMVQDKRDKSSASDEDNKESKSIIYLDDKEIVQFNNSLDRDYNLSTRDKLLLKVLLFSGITASELINIKVEDITYGVDEKISKDKKVLKLHIKGDDITSRDIPLPLRFIYDCYDQYIMTNYIKKDEYLFSSKYNDTNKQLSTQTILQITKKAFQSSGIVKDKITTEIFRNSFAIYLKNQRFQDKEIQKLLGHHNLKATYAITKYATKTNYLCSDEFELLDRS